MSTDLDGLTAAVVNLTIVMEGIHDQMALLRQELVKQREEMQRGIDDPICVDAVAGELEKMMGGY
jgi:hypothetical protein